MSVNEERLATVHHWLGIAYYGAGLVGIAAVVLRQLGYHNWWIAVVLAISIFVCAWLWRSRLARTSNRLGLVNPQLDVIKHIATYRLCGNDSFEFQQDIKVRSLAHGVDVFRLKQKWTGDGTMQYTVTPSSAGRLQPEAVDKVWDSMVLAFQTPLAKGERRAFTIQTKINRTGERPLPMLAKLIDDSYPKGIKMIVEWESNAPLRVERSELQSPRASTALGKSFHAVKKSKHAWKIRYPKSGHKYMIKWT